MVLGPLLFFALLTVVHTWPLASDPAHLGRDNADTQLNAWIVSWIAHQLPREPTHLFDANIFFPERRALAFSEPLIPPGVCAIAPRALGASAMLTYNLLLMAGFFLTALAGYALGRRLTGDRLAGLLAGSLVSFGPHTLTRLAHLQAHWLVTLPLALLALDAVVRKRTWRPALALGGCMALLAMTSGYGLALGVAAVGAGWLARADEWWPHWRRLLPRLSAAALLSVLLALPVLLPYWHVVEEQGISRDTSEAASLAALPPPSWPRPRGSTCPCGATTSIGPRAGPTSRVWPRSPSPRWPSPAAAGETRAPACSWASLSRGACSRSVRPHLSMRHSGSSSRR